MAAKSEQLQIRVTAEQKRQLRQAARRQGKDVSAWVLEELLPDSGRWFQSLVRRLRDVRNLSQAGYFLAELNDALTGFSGRQYQQAFREPPRAALSPEVANMIAAMLEESARRHCCRPPEWVAQVPVPSRPSFASSLASLRLHLLANSPVLYRRRNLYVDSGLGDRV